MRNKLAWTRIHTRHNKMTYFQWLAPQEKRLLPLLVFPLRAFRQTGWEREMDKRTIGHQHIHD
jgi:hypothetical protein